MQASDWSGTIGANWAASWRETDLSFAALDKVLVERIVAALSEAIAPRVLDIGCGAGSTALAVAERCPGARIVGIDLSPALIEVAARRARIEVVARRARIEGVARRARIEGATRRARIEGVARRARDDRRCTFAVADAGAWAGEDDFDLLISRHGVMFFDDPVAAFTRLRGRAKPGAPLLFSCFRAAALNPWASDAAALLPPSVVPAAIDAPGPFAFADPARVETLLMAAGWHDVAFEPVDYRYVAADAPDPIAAARDFFLRIGPIATPVRALDDTARAAFLDRFAGMLAGYRDGDRIVFPAAAWICSARA